MAVIIIAGNDDFVVGDAVAIHIVLLEIEQHGFEFVGGHGVGSAGSGLIGLQPFGVYPHLGGSRLMGRIGNQREGIDVAVGSGDLLTDLGVRVQPRLQIHAVLIDGFIQGHGDTILGEGEQIAGSNHVNIRVTARSNGGVEEGGHVGVGYFDPVDFHTGLFFKPFGHGQVGKIHHITKGWGPDRQAVGSVGDGKLAAARQLGQRAGADQQQAQRKNQGEDTFHTGCSFQKFVETVWPHCRPFSEFCKCIFKNHIF